jgi:predicted MFS family arabinose efflux permease
LASALCGISGFFWLGHFERRRCLLALYGAFAVATLGCGLAPSAGFLLGARLLAGGCAGLTSAVVMDLIADAVPVERRGEAIGFVMSAYAVAAVAGVPLGLWAASVASFRAPFWLLTLAAFGLWLAVWRSVAASVPSNGTEPHAMLAPLREVLRSPRLWGGWVLTFLVVCAGFLMIPYLAAFFVGNLDVSPARLGLLYLCGGATTFFSSRLVGAAVDRWGPARVLGALLIASCLPHLVLTQLRQARFAEVIVCFILFMTLTSGRMIPTMALLASAVPARLRARYLAVNTALSDAASGAAAWWGGGLLTTLPSGQLLGFERVGWLAAGVSMLALMTLAGLARGAARPVEAHASRDAAGEAEVST